MIRLHNVCLDYPIPPSDGQSFKAMVTQFIAPRRLTRSTARSYRALHDVSLEISSKERVGIIGLNGAGKTTLLRVIAGIFTPTVGTAIRTGRVATLLDFATGFELHHTGYENVRIRLMMLGEPPQVIDRLIPEIVEFADLGEFLHRPASTYSAGMFMRLAFATSTAISPEVLVTDEMVGAGDLQFADKAAARVERLLSRDSTLVLSSHGMAMVQRFCTRVIWLHHGAVVCDGPAQDVIRRYEDSGGVPR